MWELFKFGVIGGWAALINFCILILGVEFLGLHPLVSNLFAFLIAFQISYFGHRYWTFRGINFNTQKIKQKPKFTWAKFFLVALMSFILNEGLFAIFLSIIKLYYPIALLLTLLIVPPITYLFSKFWAFKTK